MQDFRKAFLAAFPRTLPILAGFWFLGIAYGIFMNSLGFSWLYPVLMSLLIFAGSMEFVTASLLLGPFLPVQAFFLTLLVNLRHLFYGVSMLEKYGNTGKFKPYLVFGMCDESFAINYSAAIPPDIDRTYFMFSVTLLNQLYWVSGAAIGAFFGTLIRCSVKGIDFVMTTLFVVIFLEQIRKSKNIFSATVGIVAPAVSLLFFGRDMFMLPAMLLILAILTAARPWLEKKKEAGK